MGTGPSGVNGTTTGEMEATDSISTFAANAGAGRAVAGVMLGLACGHKQLQRVESADAAQRWGAVKHPKAGNREECASGSIGVCPVRTDG